MKYKVFVYGSLKRGFGNSEYLKGETFLGETQTLETKFNMVSLGAFPGVCKNGTHSIQGELYEVGDDTLELLDLLESNGRFYEREIIPLANNINAWIYILLRRIPDNNSPRINILNSTQSWMSSLDPL